MLLNTAGNLVIDTAAMKLSSFKLGRCLRFALLLLLLSAQGIVNAHELGDGHSLQADPCTTCLVGHCLGAAVNVSYEAPQVPVGHTPISIYSLCEVLVFYTQSHFARAPPGALWTTQNPI